MRAISFFCFVSFLLIGLEAGSGVRFAYAGGLLPAIATGDPEGEWSEVDPILPVLESHPWRGALPAAFVALGPMAEVGPLIWSAAAPGLYHQEAAIEFCRDTIGGGARLPTADDYYWLSRALGARNPLWGTPGFCVDEYNVSLLPDLEGRSFWSSSRHPRDEDYAISFSGGSGVIDDDTPYSGEAVRCVIEVGR
jgi:hypothetical protein